MQLPADQNSLRRLVAGKATAQQVTNRLASMAPGAEIGGLRLTRCKFKPGRTLRASYDVDVAGRSWPVVVNWSDRDLEQRQAASDVHAQALRASLPTPFRSLFEYDADLKASIIAWPYDPALPQLSSVIERCAAQGSTVTANRYRPSERHVLNVLRHGAEPQEFVKVNRDDDKSQIGPALAAIETAAANAQINPAVRAMLVGPDPTATAANGALTYRRAAGTAVSSMTTSEDVVEAIQTAAQLVAGLHTVEPANGLPVRTVADELALVARASQHVTCLAPELGRLVNAVMSDAKRLVTQSIAPRLVHGDLKLDHIFASGGAIQLIDLDGFRLADPATDLAKLMAELRFLQIDQNKIGMELAAKTLTDSYAAVGDPDIVERALRLEPALLLKMAARRVSVVDASWQKRVTAVVREAHRLSAEFRLSTGLTDRTDG